MGAASRRASGEASGGSNGMLAAASRSIDPRSGEIFRHHLHEQSVQRVVYGAARRSGDRLAVLAACAAASGPKAVCRGRRIAGDVTSSPVPGRPLSLLLSCYFDREN